MRKGILYLLVYIFELTDCLLFHEFLQFHGIQAQAGFKVQLICSDLGIIL